MPITSPTTPVVTLAQFRSDFSEFADSVRYPDNSVNYWLAIATIQLNANRFDANMLIIATELYIAHNLVLEAQAQQTAKAAGWPGVSKGVISGENAGAVSVSYDTTAAIELDAGHWNLTVFGIRFIRLAKMFGAGPIQVGCGAVSLPGGNWGFGMPGWGVW